MMINVPPPPLTYFSRWQDTNNKKIWIVYSLHYVSMWFVAGFTSTVDVAVISLFIIIWPTISVVVIAITSVVIATTVTITVVVIATSVTITLVIIATTVTITFIVIATTVTVTVTVMVTVTIVVIATTFIPVFDFRSVIVSWSTLHCLFRTWLDFLVWWVGHT